MSYPTFVDTIFAFNKQAGLLDKPYDDFLESSFQIEEALEGFPMNTLAQVLGKTQDYANPKDISRLVLQYSQDFSADLSDVDRLDKACDAIVFAVGSIAKLGLTAAQASEAVSIVMEANMAKLTMPKDSHGKLMKPADFVGPEAKLQALLDTRDTVCRS